MELPMNTTEFVTNFVKLHKAGTSLELRGGPGGGKSSIMHQGCAALSIATGVPVGCYTMVVSGMDPADIRGFLFPIKNEDGSLHARFTRPTVFPSHWNTKVYINGVVDPNYNGVEPEFGVVFFDEFAQAEVEVQKPLAQVILDKQMGEYQLSDRWVVWMASNRLQDRSGVVKQLAFIENRRKIYELEIGYGPWEDWAIRAGVHPLIISFAKAYPHLVFLDAVPKAGGQYTTPRSLVKTGVDLMAFRDTNMPIERLPDDKLAHETVIGWLGEGTAPIFMSHIRLANDLPTLESVARSPMEAKCPTRPDAQYVMAMTLAFHINKKNGAAFIKYMSRMGKELQILFVTNAVRRAPETLNVPEFQKWTEVNKDLALIAFG
jgi:hypothetical protein